MDDLLAFLAQNSPFLLIVGLMVLMHVFGHGAHGQGSHTGHPTARTDERSPDQQTGPRT